eukprot:15130577-Alexandrium_andersonii.AAC.1
MDAVATLGRHYEQHFAACCERVSMESTQLSFAALEVGSIALDLEQAHGRADWGTAAPSDRGWRRQPRVTDFQRAP